MAVAGFMRGLVLLGLAILAATAGCIGSNDEAPAANNSTPALRLTCASPCEDVVEDPDRRVFEPSAAADPTNPDRIVAVSTEIFEDNGTERRWFKVHTTEDRGENWTTHRLFGTTELGPQHPLAGCNHLFDPVVDATPNGTYVLTGVAQTKRPTSEEEPSLPKVGPPPRRTPGVVFVARSSDGGQAFSEVEIVTDNPSPVPCPTGSPPGTSAPEDPDHIPDRVRDRDKPWIDAGPGGRVLVGWTNLSGTFQIKASLSTDAGRSFSNPSTVTDFSTAEGFPFAPSTAVGPEGNLFVAWVEAARNSSVVVARSTDGASWEHLDRANSTFTFPRLETRRSVSGTQLLLAYETVGDNRTLPTLATAGPEGSLSDPFTFDQNASSGERMTTLTVDGNGTAYLGFFHPLEDDGASNAYRVAAYRNATTYGPVQVNNSAIGEQSFLLDLGHYMGIAGLDEGAYPVWINGEAPDTGLRGAFVDLVPAPADDDR